MACLITNLPSQEVWVRKEYLDGSSKWTWRIRKEASGFRQSRFLDVLFILRHIYGICRNVR